MFIVECGRSLSLIPSICSPSHFPSLPLTSPFPPPRPLIKLSLCKDKVARRPPSHHTRSRVGSQGKARHGNEGKAIMKTRKDRTFECYNEHLPLLFLSRFVSIVRALQSLKWRPPGILPISLSSANKYLTQICQCSANIGIEMRQKGEQGPFSDTCTQQGPSLSLSP